MKSIQTIEHEAGQSLKTRGNLRAGALGLIGLVMLCFLSTMSFGIAGEVEASETAPLVATLVPFALMGGLREKSGEDLGGGGGAPDPDPLAAKIIGKIDGLQKSYDELQSKVGENAEFKTELEDLQKAITKCDGLSTEVKDVTSSMAKLERKLANVKREHYGDPLARLTGDEEKRTMIASLALVPFLKKKNATVSDELLEANQRMQGVMKAVTGGATPGSNYVDTEVLSDVYQLAAQYGKYNLFDVIRPGARTVKVPVDTSDPTMLWESEGVAGSEGSYTGTSQTLNIKDCMGWISVSNSLLEDDITGVAQRLMVKYFRAAGYRLDYSCFSADGTADTANGSFEGIFDVGTTFTAASGNVSVATLDFEDFLDLQAGCDEALVGADTTRWFFHPQMLVRCLRIQDANGRPIFQTSLEAPSSSAIGSILGDGVERSSVCPNVDGASKPICAYGDTQALAVALRKDMEFASSTEAEFKANKTVFRTVMRGGVKVKDTTAFEVMTTSAT